MEAETTALMSHGLLFEILVLRLSYFFSLMKKAVGFGTVWLRIFNPAVHSRVKEIEAHKNLRYEREGHAFRR